MCARRRGPDRPMAAASSFLLAGLLLALRANTSQAEQYRNGQTWRESLPAAEKVTLPLETGAACLDGSPYAFYVFRNASSTRWTININGGGWCYNETDCAVRTLTPLGTSNGLPPTRMCPCMYYDAVGEMETGCNCADLIYCDGASFSGFREKPWPVPPGQWGRLKPNNISELNFRGILNLDGVVDHLWHSSGLNQATELVVTGGSAGGLSTFLHADRIAARVPHARVTAAPVVGYFLDHPQYPGRRGVDPYHAYPEEMKYVTAMQNVTEGALKKECMANNVGQEWKCIMSPHMAKYITTPFYMFNSKFDAWQMGSDLQVGCLCKQNTSTFERRGGRFVPIVKHPYSTCPRVDRMPNVDFNCDIAQQKAIAQYGHDFLVDLAPVLAMPANGAFITSCICHGCDFNNLGWAGKNARQHYSDWYNGRVRGKKTVDTRGPNGGGALTPTGRESGWTSCEVGY